jgi:hypothetical protein
MINEEGFLENMKIKVWAKTNNLGSKVETEIEIDESEFEDMSDFEREQYIEDSARDAMFNLISWDYEVVE